MRIVGLISGGKDSVFNMLQCIAAGHEIVAVANIAPDKEMEMDSYMYQSVGHEAVSLIAGALGLPIYRQTTKGRALNKSKSYVETLNDEVEDLVKLLNKVKTDTVIEGISVGAIASDYQRTRVENVCSRLGFKCFAYLWNRDQAELLQEMIDADVDAIIIKVAAIGLDPDIHLGMDLKTMQQHLLHLNKKFGVSICGEGGEYETLTLDCPLFHRKITITESDNVILSNDAFAPVASLSVKNASLIPKFWGSDDPVHSLQARLAHIKAVVKHPYDYIRDIFDEVSENIFPQNPKKPSSGSLPFPFENDQELLQGKDEPSGSLTEYWKKQYISKSSVVISYPLPSIDSTNVRINYSTGWCALGNIIGESAGDALRCLKKHLERISFQFHDIVMVNLYVREMSDFAKINKIYSQYFPTVQPPARSCVAIQLPPGVALIVSVVGHKLISRSLKALSSVQLLDRTVMHVQSISHWAPANIGPYSQCVKVGELYYLAGQIPLIPGTMEILNKPIFFQCKLTLRHIQRVMKAVNESLDFSNILHAICYVTSMDIAPDIYSMWIYITGNEKTPVTVVEVKELPKNSQVEWEVVACGTSNPLVLLETQVTNEYFLQMKRCVHSNPFASCIVAKVSPPKNVKGRKSPLGSGTYLKILKECVQFLKSSLENIGTPLCILKIFFKSSEIVITTVINDVIKSCSECKVVVTAIPVFGCEDPNVFLTVSGICH